LLSKDQHKRIIDFNQIKKLTWLKNIDWQIAKSKKLKTPIKIDLYQNNVHDEFLEVDLSEINLRFIYIYIYIYIYLFDL